MFLADPLKPRFAYTSYMDLGFAYDPAAKDALMIGLGGGSVAKQTWGALPRVRLTTVELDPAVRDVAYRYFALPHDPRLSIVIDDGRHYLAQHGQLWDVVILDAFYADAVPFHLTTQEFLQLVHSRLAPGGVVVTNMIGSLAGPNSRLLRSFLRTYHSVFPMVDVYPVKVPGVDCAKEICNVIIVAGDGPRPDGAELRANWKQASAGGVHPLELDSAIAARSSRPLPLGDVPTLTDDYAPTDSMLLLYK
jgi:spermidine synthase